jgi:hypothetical protein
MQVLAVLLGDFYVNIFRHDLYDTRSFLFLWFSCEHTPLLSAPNSSELQSTCIWGVCNSEAELVHICNIRWLR